MHSAPEAEPLLDDPRHTLTEQVPVLSQHIATLNDRIRELANLAGLDPADLTDYFTSDPSSPEGRRAKEKVHSLAEGFMGSIPARRAMVLEPSRILAQHILSESLLVWGSEKPEEHAQGGLPQNEYERLVNFEKEVFLGRAPEHRGLANSLRERSIRILQFSGWLVDLIEKEASLDLETLSCVGLNLHRMNPAVQVIFFGHMIRNVDDIWWAITDRVKRIIRNLTPIRGPMLVQELAINRWADEIVNEAVRMSRENPDSGPCSAALINEVARMTQAYRVAKHLSTEAHKGLQNAVDEMWEVVSPFSIAQSVLRSFS